MTNQDDFVNGDFFQVGDCVKKEGGLTKREYFAALALQGILASDGVWSSDKLASMCAVKQADYLIEELNK
jgi:hypothetical protein